MSPGDRVQLRTGPLTAVLIGGTLRDVRVAGHRALDAVYAALRDPDWGTSPGEITVYDVRRSTDAFTVEFVSCHGATFVWRGRIEGRDGMVMFDFDGEILGELAANRVGFCLLHPIELAGKAVVARTERGASPGRFPDRISPYQPFIDLVGLGYDVAVGARLELAFSGELFEMEDHRNWADAGFKTYCTPLRRPYPVRYRQGDRIRQTVRISASTTGQVAPPPQREPTVRVGDRVVGRLPRLGFGVSGPHAAPLLARLRETRPTHVYAEVAPDVDAGGCAESLARAAAEVAALETELDFAVLAPAGTPTERLAEQLTAVSGRIGRVSVFDPATGTTEPGTAAALRAALRRLGIDVPVGGGTRASFAELNRMRLPAGELDFVTYGVTPRTHHDDDELVMDTLLALPHTVRDARSIGGGLPVVVRPVTLHPPGAPPDPRQRGAFLAAWTVGSLAAFAGAGAAAVTYFAGAGPTGLLSDPADPFPVWRVLAAVAGQAGEPVYAVEAPRREIAALAVGRLVLVANLRPLRRSVRLMGRPGERMVTLPPYAVEEVRW